MNREHLIGQMMNNTKTILNLAQGVSADQARWKPDDDSWSILEVINHLYDEEREDFRVRLDIIFHHPEQPWPVIDPQGWITDRQYNQRDFEESVKDFLTERDKSLFWLQELGLPKWETIYTSPFGQMSAGDMFAAWVGHDLLHIRQLVELHWAYTVRTVKPYRVDYAGDW